MFNIWTGPLVSQQGAGSAIAGTAQASVLNGQAKYPLPGQFLQFIGQKLRIRAHGVMTTAASSPGTINWAVVFGAISVYTSGASGTLATSASGVNWDMQIDLTVRSVGSSTSATLEGGGLFTSTALSAATPILVLNSPGPLTGFDSTVASVVDLQVTLGSASDNITVHGYVLESVV